jgi:REP element-mobilizing transposase RayT
MWNLPAPPGFQGLHPDKPLKVYIRRMPHWRQEGATYFVTFRLGDSLPQNKLNELDHFRCEWEQRHPQPRNDQHLEELAREVMLRVEGWLDQGIGCCLLKERAAAQQVVEAMHYFDGVRCELDAYVVMPNHVHVLVRPLTCELDSLERLLHSWKRHTSQIINRSYRRRGSLWQEESFDRIIRDEEHLYRALQYIGANPAKAGLPLGLCPRWVRPEWVQLGWRFEVK